MLLCVPAESLRSPPIPKGELPDPVLPGPDAGHGLPYGYRQISTEKEETAERMQQGPGVLRVVPCCLRERTRSRADGLWPRRAVGCCQSLPSILSEGTAPDGSILPRCTKPGSSKAGNKGGIAGGGARWRPAICSGGELRKARQLIPYLWAALASCGLRCHVGPRGACYLVPVFSLMACQTSGFCLLIRSGLY